MDIQDGRCTVNTLDSLKQEIRSQVFPQDVKIIAIRKLRELKYAGRSQTMLSSFLGMLDICDMSETHKVFSFVEGLKLWAKIKLYEQRVCK